MNEGLVDPADAWGSQANASSYERGRPSYPPAALAWLAEKLGLRTGVVVLDLGAGTGKFTRLLANTGADVIAVEPQDAMRAELARSLPGVPVKAGTAEAIPLPDHSVDAVCAATAFHWFDHSRAMHEIARVVRLGGKLGLVWMERDETVPWVRRMTEIIRWDGYRPYGIDHDWTPLLTIGGHFRQLDRRQFAYEQLLDRQTFADRVASISYIATLTEDERAPILAACDELVAGFAEPFALPYQCDVLVAG